MNRFSLRASIGVLVIAAMMLQPVITVAAVPSSEKAATWTLNFNNTDIKEFIHFVAEASGKTVIIDPKVNGKIQVVSTRAVGADELYQLFLSVLQVHGYIAVESAGVVRVVPAKSARSEALPVVEETGNTRDFVTHVIQLENISAAKLVPVLRPLVAQQSHLAAYAPSNAIIIADTAANIRRIRKIIATIDQAAVDRTDVLELRYASAEDTVRMIEQLEKENAAKGGSQSLKVKLVADTRTNSVLISGDEIQRNRIKTLVRYIDTPLSSNSNAKVVYLQYAQAADVAEVIGKVVDNMAKMGSVKKGAKGAAKTSSATVVADEATNSLVVTADASVMATVDSIIEKLDIRRSQVLVEAIIVEVNDGDDKNLGVEWMGTGDKAFGSSIAKNGSIIGGIADGLSKDDPKAGLAGALASTAGGTLGFAGKNFIATLHAMESNSKYNILSKPKLLTLNNTEASIMVGREVGVTTGSYTNDSSESQTNPFTTTERKDIGLTLKITPHINSDGVVMMEISQEVSSIDGNAGAVVAKDNLVFLKRKIETNVLVDNGATVVLGGLIRSEVQHTKTKVPVLGSIPFLGRLFRSDGTSISKSNLMVFIRPTIIRSAAQMSDTTRKPYQMMRNMQMKDSKIELYPEGSVPMLPEWKEQLNRLGQIRDAETAARN